MKAKEIYKLSDLTVGQTGRVLALKQTNKEIRRHLLDMGITKGTKITIKKIAPMGDPVDIALRGYELCICKSDLQKIEVEVL